MDATRLTLAALHLARFASYCAGVQVFICNACICGISMERASCTLRIGGRSWSLSGTEAQVVALAHGRGGTAPDGDNSHPMSFEQWDALKLVADDYGLEFCSATI